MYFHRRAEAGGEEGRLILIVHRVTGVDDTDLAGNIILPEHGGDAVGEAGFAGLGLSGDGDEEGRFHGEAVVRTMQ